MSNPEIYMPVGIPHGSAQSQNWRDGTQTRNGGLHIYLTYMHLSLVLQIHPSACLAVGNADLSPCLSIRGSEQPIYLSGHSSACSFIRHFVVSTVIDLPVPKSLKRYSNHSTSSNGPKQPTIDPFVHRSVHAVMQPCVHACIPPLPSIEPSIHRSIVPSLHQSICLPIYRHINPSVHPSVRPSVHVLVFYLCIC
jgi:hypothetical protein